MRKSFEKISESPCPSCGLHLDSATPIDNDTKKPDIGSVAVCLNCGILSVYSSQDASGKLILTEPSDEFLKKLRAEKEVWDHILSIKAEIYASIIDGTHPFSLGRERITNPLDFLTIDTQITPEDNMAHEITHRIDSTKNRFDDSMSTKDIQEKYADNPDWFCIVSMMQPRRLGSHLFTVLLEYNNFKPGTDKNKDFQLIFVKWQEMIYAIIVIPYKEKDLAYKVAEEVGMRISDCIPMVLTGNGQEVFPIISPRVFSLENSKDSPVYRNNLYELRDLEKEEDKKIDNIFADHENWLLDNTDITEYK